MRNRKRFLAVLLSLSMATVPATSLTLAEEMPDTAVEQSTEEKDDIKADEIEAPTKEGTAEDESETEDHTKTEDNTANEASADTAEKEEAEKTGNTENTQTKDTENADEKDTGEAPSEEEVKDERPDPISGNAGVTIRYQEDGTEFGMFRVQGSEIVSGGSELQVSVASSRANYSGIFVGTVEDFNAGNGITYSGIENNAGLYNITVTVPASAAGTNVPIVLVKPDGSAYVNKQLVLAMPGAGTPVATPTPTVTPEVTPIPAPELQVGEKVQVVKETDGTAFKMFAAKEDETTAIVKDGKIEISFVTENTSYDRIYLGGKDDETKEPVIMGTQNAAGNWCFTFTVPVSAKGSLVPIVPGNSTKGSWYSNQTLLLNLPENIAEVTPEPVVTPTPEITPTPEVTPTPAPIETVIPEDGIYSAEATTNAAMFKIVACELISRNGRMSADITLSSTGYDVLYMGSKEDALNAPDSALIKSTRTVTDADGKEQRVFTIPVNALDTPIAMASRSQRYYEAGETEKMWYDRIITISSSNLVKTGDIDPTEPEPTPIPQPTPGPDVTPTPVPSQTPTPTPTEKPSYESDTNGSTSSVNSSTTVKDGTYKPDSFSWSGGTGKVSINCDKITVRGGKAYATITFTSGKYIYVKASGSQYSPVSQNSSNTTFEIPVALNANNRIIGCTTAMSQAHEVDYNLYIGLNAAANGSIDNNMTGPVTATGADGSKTDNSMAADLGTVAADTDAPEIDGLKYQTSLKLESAQLFKVHFYDNQITVLEIDTRTDLARPDLTGEMEAEDIAEEDFTEEEGASAAETKDFFGDEKVLYVLAPEDAELPAGIDKDMIVICTPAKAAYVASDYVLNIMDKLDAVDKIAAVSAEESKVESVAAAMNEGDIVFAGTTEEPDFRELVTAKTDIAIISSDIMPETDDPQAEEKITAMKELGEQFRLLKIAMIIDRSSDEKESAARYEWVKLYSTLFGCEEKADAVIEELGKSAKKATVKIGG